MDVKEGYSMIASITKSARLLERCRIFLAAIGIVCICLLAVWGSNTCHASIPLASDSAKDVGEKVGLLVTADTAVEGTVTDLIRMAEFDRDIHGEHWDAYAHRYTSGKYSAISVYFDNPSGQIASIMILTDDMGDDAYLKAVLPFVVYSLKSIHLSETEIKSMASQSLKKSLVAVNCVATNRKISLLKFEHESGTPAKMTYHIMTVD